MIEKGADWAAAGAAAGTMASATMPTAHEGPRLVDFILLPTPVG
jgi:hypothetical protein